MLCCGHGGAEEVADDACGGLEHPSSITMAIYTSPVVLSSPGRLFPMQVHRGFTFNSLTDFIICPAISRTNIQYGAAGPTYSLKSDGLEHGSDLAHVLLDIFLQHSGLTEAKASVVSLFNPPAQR